MNLGEHAIHKKTITLMFVILIIGGGFLSYENLGRLEDPEFTIKEALVVTYYPGASPTEVEEEVADIIETAIQQMGQVEKVTSVSRKSMSIVTVEMKDKYDKHTLPQIWDELRRKVGDVQGHLPPGAGPSVVNDDFGDVYGVFFAITGDGYSYREIKDYADDLRRELLLVKDVAKIEFYGVQQEVVYVEMSRSRMTELGVSQRDIYNTLNQQNTVSPAGQVKVGPEYIRISPTGMFESVDEIGKLLVHGGKSDSFITLGDVANITRGYAEPPQTMMRFNGQPAIGLGISTVSGGNVVKMGEAIRKRLDELEANRPIGMELGIVSYQSESVKKSVNSFVLNLAEALAIVIGVLMIFMGIRSGILIGAILLLTVCATFIFMNIFHINLQRISLGALIIALGMLVDNAIVVTEGILIYIQRGKNRIRAAALIVSQTMWPLFGATVVAVFAFSGIGFAPGSVGEFCRSLFQVILISLMMSWVLAVTVTPLFCTMLLTAKPGSENQDLYGGLIFRTYKRFLIICLNWRKLACTLMIGLLALSVYGFGFVKDSFFPSSTRPQFMIDYWRPEGTHITETAKDMEKIEQYLMSMEEVATVASFIGSGATRFTLVYSPEKPDTAYGQLLVTVKDYHTIDGMLPEIRQFLWENFPDAEPKTKKFVLGPGGGAKIKVRFSGPDPKVLRQLSDQAQAIMRGDPMSKDIRDNWRQRVKVIRPEFAEAQARRVGISRSDLNQSLEMSFSGLSVGVYREENKLIPIVSRPPEGERINVDNVNDLQVGSPMTGKMVPISQLVSGDHIKWEDAIIHRQNRMRTITAECDPKIGLASPLFNRLRPQIEAIELPMGYEMEWGGEYEDSTEAQEKLGRVLPVSFLAMIVTVICLFNALRQPMIIFLCVPLAIIGVTAGLLLTGQPFSFMALLGFLSLAGMLIKNAIVLIDQINLEIREGKAPFQAVVESSVSRVRPVSMAAITTVLGMIPLLFDAFFIDMAVTIMFGLTFATVLTLIVVPVLYSIFFRIYEV
ncbi:efflux RND transporter permease subunit [Desulfonema magnum]|uniref:Acriflavin resistance protein n=1 Tax=Desulfonema magnum TaxID=45655 RepID=A0A975BX40_9BACT|nr:efflux RND transporter permease subunit [Desulfonema magnum]QTA93152.1 Acriflavin resistance protein [Desulfonema magnum]